ncbi:hypothetical protein IQ265_23270 [Nodosilinea sp. LEGE 06152]|uniref:hypothetical protein n=1 Tax=Nodosilinea sp. LEGE 06152 TaxID=2777966 RepID=UPI001882BAD4|nr:hypothetical protein [Nodosilinea sp. LEGE 06152]MBE9159733.1 hypothetical protein [Nodosilinea sp. LEGE 06152]
MTNPNDNIFPLDAGEIAFGQCGLTKREYFAAKAMEGLLAAELIDSHSYPRDLADMAVQRADALITALNQQRTD